MTNFHYLPNNATSERLEDCTEIRFRTPSDYPFLEGHFPSNPIVPAVAQIGWCLEAIANDLGDAPTGFKINRFKFVSPMLPKQLVLLRFQRTEVRYSFTILAEGNKASSGSISLSSNNQQTP